MCSFGKPLKFHGKFYTGNLADTPWNRDLLWKSHVTLEAQALELESSRREGCVGLRRTQMGVTGSLVSETMMHMLKMEEKKRSRRQKGSKEGSESARASTGRSGMGRTTRRSQTARTTGRTTGRTREELRVLRGTLVEEVQRRQAAEKRVTDLEDKVNKLMESLGQQDNNNNAKGRKKK
eukprot:g897.t1